MSPSNQIKVGVLFAIIFAFVSFRSIEESPTRWWQRNDFAHYFTTSSLLRAGVNPYGKNLTLFYAERALSNTPAIEYATNPPALAALVAPLTVFPPRTAFILWTAIQLAAFWGALVISTRLLPGLSLFNAGVAAAVALFTYPVLSHLQYGQTQALLLLLVVAGWGCAAKDRALLGCALWGVAASLKIFTWPFVILSYSLKRGQGVASFLVGFSFLNLVAVIIGGAELFTSFFDSSTEYIYRSILRFNASSSLLGAILHSREAIGAAPLAIVSVKALSLGLTVACALIAAAIELCLPRSKGSLPIRVAVYLLISVLFAPTAWSHYLVFAAVPLLVLWASLQSPCTVLKVPNKVELVIALFLVGLSQGRVREGGVVWEIAGSWWGPVAIVYLLFLLFRLSRQLQEDSIE